MLFQSKRLLQEMSGVLVTAEYLLLLFLPLTEVKMPERTDQTWPLPGERDNIPKNSWKYFSWDCGLKEEVQYASRELQIYLCSEKMVGKKINLSID